MPTTKLVALYAVTLTLIFFYAVGCARQLSVRQIADEFRGALLLDQTPAAGRIEVVRGSGNNDRIAPDLAAQRAQLGHHSTPDLAPGGQSLAFAVRSEDSSDESVIVCRLDTSSCSSALKWHGNVWSVKWSPDGRKLAMIADAASGR